jgi:8-oxo-dGTP pyrophosphatase MutT (NUDIX family)
LDKLTTSPYYVVPISIKGIVFEDHKVWLRKNERGEWELPGGKLDIGEQPEETVVRELREELGFNVSVLDIVQSHLFTINYPLIQERNVLVVSYLCNLIDKVGEFEVEGEAGKAEFDSFLISEISELNMPQFYKEGIIKAYHIKQGLIKKIDDDF